VTSSAHRWFKIVDKTLLEVSAKIGEAKSKKEHHGF
jgi:hypothetical protein